MATAKMTISELAWVTQYLIAARRQENVRFSEIDAYYYNLVLDIYVPKRATEEFMKIVDQSRWNILPLLENSLANNFFIDGYRQRRSASNAEIWDKVWQPNRLDARQAGFWRPSLRYGMGYATALPGELNGEKCAVITPRSPKRCTAVYADPVNDEWPQFFMTVDVPRPVRKDGRFTLETEVAVYDDTRRYRFPLPSAQLEVPQFNQATGMAMPLLDVAPTIDVATVKAEEHGMTVPPLVRFLESHGDLDNGPQGILYPMLPLQRQLNQTTFGLLMAQQYAAFRQRYVTGMAIDEDEDGNPKNPFNAAVDQMFQAEGVDTKFGEFSETNLDGYLNSRDKALLFIASSRQIPPHTLVVGNAVSNISAEALAALEAGHQQDIAEHKVCFGEAAEQLMRLGGKAIGDEEAWRDTTAQVRWRDTTPRSLAQVADALGKLAQMLNVPKRALWERIPDVTDQDLETWEKLLKEDDSFAKLEGLMNGGNGSRPAANPAPAAAVNGNRRRPIPAGQTAGA